MALAAFCTVCQRTVYVDENSTPVCPVCSSPLLETARAGSEPGDGDQEDDDDQTDAEK